MGDFYTYENDFLTDEEEDVFVTCEEDCCGETICNLGAGDQVDVYFDNITDCVDCDFDIEDLNGNTYRCSWDASDERFEYNVSEDIQINCECKESSGNYYLAVYVFKWIGAGWFYAFSNIVSYDSGDLVGALPQKVYNDYVIGDCASLPYCAGILAHGGDATVSKV